MAQSAVASGTSSVRLLSARAGRQGFVIENSDANRLYVLLGSGTATSTTAYSFSLAQNETSALLTYSGDVFGIWSADGAGNALITEW
jgi:hypothetical protein